MSAPSRMTAWRAYRRNPLAMLGLIIVVVIILLAVFADVLTPYPEHVGPVGDFAAMNAAPSGDHPFGSDNMGRDLLTRIIFGYRLSLMMAVVVLSISAPIGVIVGLVAGYSTGGSAIC